MRNGAAIGKIFLAFMLSVTMYRLPYFLGFPVGQRKKIEAELVLKDYIPPGLTKDEYMAIQSHYADRAAR